jgi:ElaB/YqjD/DUF883 family membrane-anchored ribosome-binding protein
MTTGTDANVQALQAEMAQLRADFAKVTDTLKQIAANRGAEFIGDAKDTADRFTAEMQRHARTVTDTVEERPYAAAITSFGIGLILGMLFSGRR